MNNLVYLLVAESSIPQVPHALITHNAMSNAVMEFQSFAASNRKNVGACVRLCQEVDTLLEMEAP